MADLTTVVEIVWHDAHSESQWQELRDIDSEPFVVRTVGWVIPDAKPNHVVVCQSVGNAQNIDGVICIPVGMIQHMKVLSP